MGIRAVFARSVLLLGLLGIESPSLQAGPEMPVRMATNNFPTQPLSLADAVNIALRQSPTILRAQKDIAVTEGVAIQTKAIAIPRVAVAGNYSRVERSDVDIISNTNFSFGNDENWSSQIRVVQSLYEGGRIVSALRAARQSRQQSLLNYQTATANVVLDVEIAYYDVLLGEHQINVQEASVELLGQVLEDTKRRYNAGTVPQFNVLRAEVELANARPRLIRARNAYRIAKNNLANLLGMDVPRGNPDDIPLPLSGKLEALPLDLELPRALEMALERRTELGTLRKAQELRHEDVNSARAGYKPSVQVYAGYDAHNTMLNRDVTDVRNGWITGVQLTWNIFDGLRTQGRIKEAQALYERTGIDLDDTTRRIELEVRTAYSNFREADEVLKSQEKVVEQAQEAVRLATSRYEAGTGTQLDVLSAQTALTEARTTQVQALRDYEVARARLERAVGGRQERESVRQ